MRLRFLMLSISMLFTINLYSQIIVWSVTPEYDELKPYSEGIYYCNKGSKWGLISKEGKVLLTPKYDFITPMVEGYAIAGVKDGSKNKISCIIDESFNHTEVKSDYYLVNRYYSYFSEGKIPVSNKSGRQGFLNANGDLIIKCQFDNVHPFSNGFASIFKYPNAYYITEKYDSSPRDHTLPVDFNNGDITFASSFYNEKAVVAYNEKSAVINTKGLRIGNYKGKIDSKCYNKYDYTIVDCGSKNRIEEYTCKYNDEIITFQNNNLYGYKKSGNVIVYATFSQASSFTSNGCAIASINGKYGLLQLLDGSINSYVAKQGESTKYEGSFKASTKGDIDKYDYIISKSSNMQPSDFKIRLNNGDGNFVEKSVANDHDLLRVTFNPCTLENKSKEVAIASKIYYKGFLIHKYEQTFNVNYPASPVQVHSSSLVISGPKMQTDRANEKDVQVLCATISNSTSSDINVIATLSVPSKNISIRHSITIPASASRKITLPISNVYKRETVNATLTLSTGKSSTNQVELNPYY